MMANSGGNPQRQSVAENTGGNPQRQPGPAARRAAFTIA